MACQRCGGITYKEIVRYPISVTLERCFTCGNVVDPVILQNRTCSYTSAYMRPDKHQPYKIKMNRGRLRRCHDTSISEKD